MKDTSIHGSLKSLVNTPVEHVVISNNLDEKEYENNDFGDDFNPPRTIEITAETTMHGSESW
jgi:hypothetical protein